MPIYYPDDNPDGPWCACGCLCNHPNGWCPDCEDWATDFSEDYTDLRSWDPKMGDWRPWSSTSSLDSAPAE